MIEKNSSNEPRDVDGPRVIVIGAGIGGLALAQGLRRRGLQVAVYERDHSPTDRLQGYRVHINTEGVRALHACLPREVFAAFLATCGRPNTGIGIASHRLRELIWLGDDRSDHPSDAIDGVKSVSRISLRQVLMVGLSEVVHFGTSFTGYAHTDGGHVMARFADGSTTAGDVLVGADGASSTVRRQRLPHAERIDTGVVGIQGKVWLTDQVRTMLPSRLAHGPLMIPGPRGVGMFLAMHEFAPIPPELVALVGPEAAGQRDYVMWGLLTRRARLPSGLEQLDQEGLRTLALQRISAWHPALRRLVAASDRETMLLTAIRSAVPLEAWPPTSVTLLGDAIHSMPPTGGIGANTALRDAALLTTKLASVACGERPLLAAVADYEAEMRDYGFAAVRSSLHNLRRQQRTEHPLALTGMKLALRAMDRVPALKRRAFA